MYIPSTMTTLYEPSFKSNFTSLSKSSYSDILYTIDNLNNSILKLDLKSKNTSPTVLLYSETGHIQDFCILDSNINDSNEFICFTLQSKNPITIWKNSTILRNVYTKNIHNEIEQMYSIFLHQTTNRLFAGMKKNGILVYDVESEDYLTYEDRKYNKNSIVSSISSPKDMSHVLYNQIIYGTYSNSVYHLDTRSSLKNKLKSREIFYFHKQNKSFSSINSFDLNGNGVHQLLFYGSSKILVNFRKSSSVSVYDIRNMAFEYDSISFLRNSQSNIRFDIDLCEDLLLCSSIDGYITIYDIRNQKCLSYFKFISQTEGEGEDDCCLNSSFPVSCIFINESTVVVGSSKISSYCI